MIVEAASTDEVAEKLGALPLVREGYLQGLRSPLFTGKRAMKVLFLRVDNWLA
jgi:hypothetical protein